MQSRPPRPAGVNRAGRLARAPLLHLTSRPDAWPQWFRAFGVDGAVDIGMSIDQFATAAQAASSGLGVALLPLFLIEAEIESGTLVRAIDVPPAIGSGKYYLAWPASRASHHPLVKFREWLRDQCGPTPRST